ncbi:MAG: four helix bundle protein [Sandaracinaceae bacterium]|nr:four helix bundle protein [Sandaracinaceae bacterium]
MTNTHEKPRFNFRLYALAVQMVAALAPVADEVRRRNRDLADQMERALTSVPLNVAEGAESAGKLRIARFRTALGSANEVLACCDVGTALGYVTVSEEQWDVAEHVRATLINLVRTKR